MTHSIRQHLAHQISRVKKAWSFITGNYQFHYGKLPVSLRVTPSQFPVTSQLLLFLLLFVGVGESWGQSYETGELDEGFYYIVHNQDKTYSLCPAEDPDNSSTGKWYNNNSTTPFLTTKKGVPDDYRLWHLTKNGYGYFQIIHAKDNQYVINAKTAKEAEAAYLGNLPDEGTNTWFVVSYVTNGSYYNMKGSAVTENWSLNPYNGNKDNYNGTDGGIIGYWDNTDGGSKWQFVKVLPTITNDAGTFTISFSPAISGQKFYYTTDNSDPRSSGTRQEFTNTSFQLTGSDHKVKATVELNGHYSEVVIYNTAPCANPVITNTDGVINMTCATEGASIYYTTDGSTPTPSSTLFTSLSLPINTNIASIKAIAVKDPDYSDISGVTTLNIGKCSTPNITNNAADGTVTMTSTTGATIRYTTNGSNPGTNSTMYSAPTILLPENTTVGQIKAIAYKAGMRPSDIRTYDVPLCETPVITNSSGTITITCGTSGANIHYATTGDYSNYTEPFALGDAPIVNAYASHAGYLNSSFASMMGVLTEVASTNEMTDMSGGYKLASDFTVNSSIGTAENPFKGVIDGQYNTISSSTKPLVAYADGATIRNVIIRKATIEGSGNVGAIVNEASGNAHIYNCGVLNDLASFNAETQTFENPSTVTSTNGAAGGIVGHIASGSSVRVVNCYNYANISGSSHAAGIVGYNEGTIGDTRIAMCMMYGKLTSGTVKSPVYAGNHTSNKQDYTEYNYWRSRAYTATELNTANTAYTVYNDQLAIDKNEYLTRFPFYRHILNTHREMAAFFLFHDSKKSSVATATAPTVSEVAEIGHWVLKPDVAPYPIIEPWGKNTKRTTVEIKNNLPDTTDKFKGKLLNNIGEDGYYDGNGEKVTAMGSSGYLTVNYTIDGVSGTVSLPITDMNEDAFDYTWGKVVLPFANEFSGWTRDYSKICTGWKITGITGGTEGSLVNYNFADRDCTAKDLYSNSNYIFAQGGNYIVPYGVTAISIEANFANAFYLSDAKADFGYDTNYGTQTNLGWTMPNEYHGQTVYTDLNVLMRDMSASTDPHSQAIVLVGNYHYNQNVISGNRVFNNYTGKALTIMSVDEDNNQEPDYGWYAYHNQDSGRTPIPHLRFDFLPNIGIGMAARVTDSTPNPTIGIWQCNGSFELTETCVSFMSECEIEGTKGIIKTADNGKGNNRYIVNSGYFVQIIRAQKSNVSNLSYMKVGGNAYIEQLYPGSHSDEAKTVNLVPIIVTGGEIEECYMTGYKAGGKAWGTDIRFWCAGGKIHKFLGAYMETPYQTTDTKGTVNLTAKVDHACIYQFYGGGTSKNATITGNINITMNNCLVDFYCGGPEFGDMVSDKSVSTNAIGTTFGEYYGAGFGGTSIIRVRGNGTTSNTDGQSEVTFNSANYTYPLAFSNYHYLTKKDDYGIGVNYDFEYIQYAGGAGGKGVARFYTGYASFSLATTGNVTNTLSHCTIQNDFYGAGCQGKVDGTVTSTLTDCRVKGSAYGGGYKAENNTLNVYPNEAPTYSVYTKETGLFSDFGTVTPDTWTWVAGNGEANTTDKTLPTGMPQEEMATLGNVTGDISLTIDGNSVIGTEGNTATGNVFGGGNESVSKSDATVILKGNAQVLGNVFGGGNKAVVEGSATVNIGGETSGTTTGPTP